jgi:hypothetical protein
MTGLGIMLIGYFAILPISLFLCAGATEVGNVILVAFTAVAVMRWIQQNRAIRKNAANTNLEPTSGSRIRLPEKVQVNVHMGINTMKRIAYIIVLLASIFTCSCGRNRGAGASERIHLHQDAEEFQTGIGDGYRGPIAAPTKGLLTIRRVGQQDVVLEQVYAPGEEALFGYTYVTFKTKAGVEEHKFYAHLRYVRKDADGNVAESGGKEHEFFLEAPFSGGSGKMHNPISLGEELEFRTFRCGESGDTFTLTICFEKIPNQEMQPTR